MKWNHGDGISCSRIRYDTVRYASLKNDDDDEEEEEEEEEDA